MSCCDHSQKLGAFTQKELETVKAAQKLLGAPTIGGGGVVPRQGVVVVEGVKGIKYDTKPSGMYENGKKQAISCTY